MKSFDIEIFDSRNTSYTKNILKRAYRYALSYGRKLSEKNPFKIVVHNCENGAWVQYENGSMTEWSVHQ
jgi:hypothetical protein